MKQKIFIEIQSHFQMFGRAINVAELKDAVQTRAGFGWNSQGFKDAIDQLLQEKQIEISGAEMYKPYGVTVNENPFPVAKDITPHPTKTSDASPNQNKDNNAIKEDVGGVR